VTGSQGATVKELRAATGNDARTARGRAYEYLLEHSPLGLAVQRQRDELLLASAHVPRPGAEAAVEVLAIVAYK
jgi:hypothetical protein